MVDSVLVSINFPGGDDAAIMLVGRQRINEPVEIINAIQGEEVKELWEKLTTPTTNDGRKGQNA